jgi:hypothetical protein
MLMVRAVLAVSMLLGSSYLSGDAPAGEKVGLKPINLDKINTAADEDEPFILPSKTLLYVSNSSGRQRIMQAVWSQGWKKGKLLSGLDAKDTDFRSPFYRGDKLYFATNEIPDETLKEMKNFDIKVITAGREPLPILGVSSKEDELHPWITSDGREFYFSRKTEDGWRLFVAKGPTAGPITEPKEVGFPAGFHHATVSAGGLNMFLQGPVDEGRTGLFLAKRASLKGKWSKPEPVTLLNHPEAKRGDMSPCLSSDSKRLYFTSDRPGGKGGLDIWWAETALLFKK